MSIEHIIINGRELTAFDLPPEPSDTYHVWVDGLGEIVVEKGKPPKEKDVPAMYMRKLVPELCEQNAALFRDNAKLRELVRISIEYCNSGTCDECPIQGEDGSCPYADMARELGIEVGE